MSLVMVVLLCVVMEGWGTKEEVIRGGCVERLAKGLQRRGVAGPGAAGVRRAFVTASLAL
jgi:hypothetical protein